MLAEGRSLSLEIDKSVYFVDLVLRIIYYRRK